MSYHVQSPVLFLNFNRPDLSAIVLAAISKVTPAKLYIAVDGPRKAQQFDGINCVLVKKMFEKIDWDCEVKTLFRENNLGCKLAVSSAITWFFENESEGIILEDDCLPGDDFFYFCDQLLKRYRFDTRVNLITGTNLQRGKKRGEASYYFSQYSNIWGWASWKRAWQKYDPDLTIYDENDARHQLQNIFTDRFLMEEWMEIFKKMKAGKIDTWDYQFSLINFFENALCITPNVNLISNIGFREDATHPNANLHNANLPLQQLPEITHPIYFLPDKEADYFFQSKEFNLDEKWRKYEKDKLLRRRFKRWVRSFFTKA